MASDMDTPRNTGGTSADLQRTVDEISEMVRELRLEQSAIRRRVTIGTILILVIMLAFGAAAYYKIRANFAQDKVQEAAAIRMQLLLPQLEAPLAATLRDVVPFYVEMGRDRFGQLSPKLDLRVKEQADKLGTELEQKLGAQLDTFFTRLGNNIAPQLTEKFPALTGDNGVKATARMKQILTDEEAKLRTNTDALYATEFKRISDALAKFAVPDVKQTDIDTLNRQLLHELLMLADYEMTGPAKAVATSAPAQVH